MTPPKRQFYILRRRLPFEICYDVVNDFIVCATSETDARSIASQQPGDEGPETWLNVKHSSCSTIDPDRYDISCVILAATRTR
jgi:hypothetical protein